MHKILGDYNYYASSRLLLKLSGIYNCYALSMIATFELYDQHYIVLIMATPCTRRSTELYRKTRLQLGDIECGGEPDHRQRIIQ